MKRPDESINKMFGCAVRNERKARQWSQDNLAWRAGLNRNYVSLLELGQKSPTLNTIHCIARAFGMSKSQLLLAMEAIDDNDASEAK